MSKPVAAPCPCGSGDAPEACCARWHRTLQAPTAEALMRSRYSAYVMRDEPYLLATWHASTRPAAVAFEAGIKWLGLSLVDSGDSGDSGPDRAEVEFVARYRIGGNSAVRLHERSRFVREDGRWYYLDGDVDGERGGH